MDIGLAFIGVAFLMAIVGLYYIDYLKGKDKPEAKVDPISKGLILSFLISALLFLAEAFSFFEEGWNKKHIWLHFLVAISLITVFMFVAQRRNPLPYHKQRKIALDYVKDEYSAGEYVGNASISPLNVYKVSIEGSAEDLKGEVGNFLVELQSDNIRKYWIAINIYNGALLHLQENPPSLLENRLLGKTLPVKKDELLKDFDNEEENKTE